MFLVIDQRNWTHDFQLHNAILIYFCPYKKRLTEKNFSQCKATRALICHEGKVLKRYTVS